jgi:rRNA maturation endonuclease Nob1
MSQKYDITCEECNANFDVLSDVTERSDYCPFCGEFIPIEPDGWDEEEDEDKEWYPDS